MKKQMKTLFAFFLALTLCISVVPAEAFAAVHDAVEDAAVTTAAEKVQAAEKAAQPKEGSAEAVIQEAVYTNTNTVDLSEYNLTEKKAKKLTDKVLGDNSDSSLVDVTYDTDETGTVTTMNVEKDEAYAVALDEIATYAEEDNGGSTTTEVTKEEVGKAYAQLQKYYEDNPDYFGIAAPYFTSKTTTNPIAALLSIMQQTWSEDQSSTESPDLATIKQIIDGYYNTLQMCVGYLGDELISAKNKALEQIDDSMTTEEKLLVLNDWLGNYCTFDMSSIRDNMMNNKNDETQTASLDDATEAIAEANDDSGSSQLTPEQARQLLLNGDLKSFVESTAFGALVRRNCLCIGYSSAYTYLVQCAFPEIYKKEDGSWKTKTEVNGQEAKKDDEGHVTEPKVEPTYMVDFVKIFWDSQVTMFGEERAFDQSSHYFNAVRIDNTDDTKWYYVDSCYNDIYIECMGRNRVETDGNMTHSYFLVSHDSLADQFKGNYSKIETLYEGKSSDTTYEDAWFTKAQGPINYDKSNKTWYYVRDTSSYNFSSGGSYTEGSEQLVSRPKSTSSADFAGTDNVTVLVDYDGKEPGKATSGTELVTEGAKADDENDKIYPGLTHTSAYYNNALYINVNNEILKYDLSTNAITKVKEYNTVSAKLDPDNTGTGISNTFTGMTYKVTSDEKDAVHTVQNHPLSGIAIKQDGKLYASIATNYCYSDVDEYKTEQTNYNSDYMNYKYNNNGQQQTIKRGGNNDNQEFMWSANFVETLDMSHVTGDTHEYEEVTVAPTCESAGFTEERCKTCGIAKADSKKEDEKEAATGHHYIEYQDETYTKGSDGNNVVVKAIVCSKCMKAIPRKSSGNSFSSSDDSDELDIPADLKTGHEYTAKATSWADDNKSATVTVSCDSCVGKELDFLKAEDVTLAKDVAATDVTSQDEEGSDCTKGKKRTYTAKVTVNDKEYTATKEEQIGATAHKYVAHYEIKEGSSTCEVTFTCENCSFAKTDPVVGTVVEDKEKSVAPTCDKEGSKVYNVSFKDPDNKECTESKKVPVPATGHKYEKPEFTWSDDLAKCTATFTCENNKEHVINVECKVTNKITKEATCTEAGEATYTATAELDGKTYTSEPKTVTIPATEHKYGEPTYKWADDNTTCTASFTCEKCGDVQTDTATAEVSETTEPTCEKAGKKLYTVKGTVPKAWNTSKEVAIAATGHEYGDPKFTWSDDLASCTATFTCAKDKEHVKTVKCTVTNKITKEATCTEAGEATYTATAELDGKTYTSEPKTVTIPATEHKYGEPKFTWSDDKTACTATFTCANNKEHVEKAECKVTSSTEEATYTKEGGVTYTATCEFGGKTYTDTKEVKTARKDSKAKFKSSSYSLYSTQSGKLAITSSYKEDGIVSIKSSSPSVLAVNKSGTMTAGVVKGKAKTVTVTATVKSGKTIKTTVTVAPTKVRLNATSVPMQLKKTTTAIKITTKSFAGDQVAAWGTSNKKILTVSRSGKISAKKVGTAVVTVTMKSGATAKCKVKVQKGAVKIKKIAVNTKNVTLKCKTQKTYQLTALKTPVTVVSKVTFKTSNKKVAVVSKSGKITAKKAGKAVITVKCGNKVQKVKVTVK